MRPTITARKADGSTYETTAYSNPKFPLVIAGMVHGEQQDGKRVKYAIIHLPSGGAVTYGNRIRDLRPIMLRLLELTDWARPWAAIVSERHAINEDVTEIVGRRMGPVNEKALAWVNTANPRPSNRHTRRRPNVDPNEALKNARAAMAAYNDAKNEWDAEGAADDLAKAFEALDGWLSKGGFLPTAWQR